MKLREVVIEATSLFAFRWLNTSINDNYSYHIKRNPSVLR